MPLLTAGVGQVAYAAISLYQLPISSFVFLLSLCISLLCSHGHRAFNPPAPLPLGTSASFYPSQDEHPLAEQSTRAPRARLLEQARRQQIELPEIVRLTSCPFLAFPQIDMRIEVLHRQTNIWFSKLSSSAIESNSTNAI